MSQYTIQSLSDYIRAVCELDYYLVRNGAELNEKLLFRGQSDKNYELLPSIGRNRKHTTQISIFNEERAQRHRGYRQRRAHIVQPQQA